MRQNSYHRSRKIIAIDTPEKLKESVGDEAIILDVDDKDIEKALKIFKKSKNLMVGFYCP